MSEESMETGAAWRLPARLVRTEMVALRVELAELMRAGAPDLALDAGGVQAVDGCGLQLLLACRNDLARDGRSLTLLACSRALARALDLVGLAALLGRRSAEVPR
jgi:anti-anti-sigma regulatory factor